MGVKGGGETSSKFNLVADPLMGIFVVYTTDRPAPSSDLGPALANYLSGCTGRERERDRDRGVKARESRLGLTSL